MFLLINKKNNFLVRTPYLEVCSQTKLNQRKNHILVLGFKKSVLFFVTGGISQYLDFQSKPLNES